MQHITALDYILLPVYLGLFYAIVKRMMNKIESPELQKMMLISFGLRMFGSIAYSMLVQYYYGYGDSFTYFDGGSFFTEQINISFSNISYLFAPFKETTDWYNSTALDTGLSGHFATPASNMVMRISAILSYLALNNFLIVSLFFGFFSFLGQWKLFLVFDDINQKKFRKLLAIVILYSPSIWFWGSGLLKDSICLGSISFIIHILYTFLIKKKFRFGNLLLLIFLIYVVTVIKSYITSILFISIGVMLFSVFLKSIKNVIFRIFLIILMLGLSTILLYSSDFSSELNDIAEESVAQIEEFKTNYQTLQDAEEGSKAGFGSTREIDPSLLGLVKSSPGVILGCLFRPFLWESKKIIILFTSLESTALLFAFIYLMLKIGLIKFFKLIFKKPYLLFCFILSILFSIIIGFTTFNFGTMIRYKIIFLPFLYFMLAHMYTLYQLSISPSQAPD